MNEAELSHIVVMNRETFTSWVQISVAFSMATFFLAYVIRGTPTFVRGAVFLVFLVGSFVMFMVQAIVNDQFLKLAQDLAAANAQTAFSQGVIDRMGATATGGSNLPIWGRVGGPLIFVLNLAIAFYLLLVEKWQR